MNFLELRIPPVAVALVAALLMWLLAWSSPTNAVVIPAGTLVAITVAIVGIAMSALGVVAFKAANTTVNPTKPESSSCLVRSGIYTLTRNPMYLGFLLILFGWAIYLAHPLTFILLPAFVAYMNHFQIRAEEHALAARFGPEFVTYATRVRRWV